jgi:hypothetical protein
MSQFHLLGHSVLSGGYRHSSAAHTSRAYVTDGDVCETRNIAIDAHRNFMTDQSGLRRVYGRVA